METQERYLRGGVYLNLQSKIKEMYKNKIEEIINKEMAHRTRKYLEFCLTFPGASHDKGNLLIFLISLLT